MSNAERLIRFGGSVLAVGALLGIGAGVSHPQGHGGTFRSTFSAMLQDPGWPVSHWVALVAFTVLAWALWTLVDGAWVADSVTAQAGARLALVGTVLLAVQAGLEIVAPGEGEAYAAGEPTPVIDAVEALQAIGWPAHGIGLALVAIGAHRSAPRVIRALGVVGGLAFAAAGVLVEGMHIIEASFLFSVGGALHVWLLWAGVRAALRPGPARRTVSPSTAAAGDRGSAGTGSDPGRSAPLRQPQDRPQERSTTP